MAFKKFKKKKNSSSKPVLKSSLTCFQTCFDIYFKKTGFKPVQTRSPPITDRGVSRGLLYISRRQAPPTSNR